MLRPVLSMDAILGRARLVVRSHPRDTIERVLVRWRPGKPSHALTADADWQHTLLGMLGGDSAVLESAAAAFSLLPEERDPDGIDASPALAVASYVAVAALTPDRVVETGVGRGFTTHMILSALDANGRGRLASIDLPPGGESRLVLGPHPRWTLLEGSTRRLLPGLLEELGTIDLFVHDSAHTYRNTLFELKSAWPRLRAGGVILVDDADWNVAFEEFVATHPCEHVVAAQIDKPGVFGVIRKPRG
jgi:predicted O-methyltransferase YrrM